MFSRLTSLISGQKPPFSDRASWWSGRQQRAFRGISGAVCGMSSSWDHSFVPWIASDRRGRPACSPRSSPSWDITASWIIVFRLRGTNQHATFSRQRKLPKIDEIRLFGQYQVRWTKSALDVAPSRCRHAMSPMAVWISIIVSHTLDAVEPQCKRPRRWQVSLSVNPTTLGIWGGRIELDTGSESFEVGQTFWHKDNQLG